MSMITHLFSVRTSHPKSLQICLNGNVALLRCAFQPGYHDAEPGHS